MVCVAEQELVVAIFLLRLHRLAKLKVGNVWFNYGVVEKNFSFLEPLTTE